METSRVLVGDKVSAAEETEIFLPAFKMGVREFQSQVIESADVTFIRPIVCSHFASSVMVDPPPSWDTRLAWLLGCHNPWFPLTSPAAASRLLAGSC